MNWLKQLFSRRHLYNDLSEEIREHLEEKIAELVASGMSKKEATTAARRAFGNVTLIEEDSRAVWRWPSLENLLRDIRFGLRVLRKNPGFTITAVLTLAIGIGANTAIFSVLESQLWRPLPFPDSERLVDAHVVLRKNPRQWDVITNSISSAWAEQNHTFSSLGAYTFPSSRNLTAGGTSERVRVMELTSSLFKTLDAPLERGRTFLPEEETVGGDHVAILSHALWQTKFGSDANLIGKSITVDGEPYLVVGIASPRLRFEYLPEPAIYVPLVLDPAAKVMRGIYMIGRLGPGVSVEGARAELDGILQRQAAKGAKQEDIAAVSNLRVAWTEYSARSLYFFAGAILLVLLIACVNNAGLLLARGLSRQREFALRATLGASRATLIRQSLAESLLLSLIGGAAGTLLGIWGASAFPVFLSEDALPRRTENSLDWRVLLFVLGVSILSALLMGIMPALFSSRVDVTEALRKGTGGLSANRRQHRTRSALVAVEVALALVLLFGAGLFLSSFLREEQAPRGFDAPGALTFHITLRGENYRLPEQQQRYFRTLTDQLQSLPGVRDVTMGSGVPLDGSQLFASVNVAGQPLHNEYGTGIIVYAVEPNFFDVLHMRLLAGRTLNSRDTESASRVGILNRNAAHTLFGSQNPLERVLNYVEDERRGVPAEAPVQIVGVTENTQEFGPSEFPFDVIYVPFSQHPDRGASIVVSSSLPRGALLSAIREAAYSLDKDQPLYDIKTVDQLIGDSLRGSQFDLILVSCLAVVALALVSVGVFGTVAYFVQQRTQEFGIRFALGATPAHVLRQAVGRTYVMGVTGVLCGVAVALALGRFLGRALYLVPHEHNGMLYGVKIYDPTSMLLAAVLLFVALFFASFIPARRATRVDPMVALRYE